MWPRYLSWEVNNPRLPSILDLMALGCRPPSNGFCDLFGAREFRMYTGPEIVVTARRDDAALEGANTEKFGRTCSFHVPVNSP